ncbi:metallophosphoesterase [Rhodococcus triatomae]
MRRTLPAIAALAVALAAPTVAQGAPALGAIDFGSSAGTGSSGGNVDGAPAAPAMNPPGGRYERPVQVSFDAQRGAAIHYTLDGSTPTADSPVLAPGTSLTVTEDSNVSAVAVRGEHVSSPVTAGYVVRSEEEPVAQLVVMSDVHVGDYEKNRSRYESFFDTIASIYPEPDAILSNGDMINDNWNGKGPDHKIVSQLFRENLARKGMDTTKVFMSYGNHDAYLEDVRAGYPQEWFPDSGGGYYESNVNGVPLFTLNTETYNNDTAQRDWLKGRLAEITADPENLTKPILVQGHRPITGTVMDGQQASNPRLSSDLAAFPQVVYFSGHSHLNNNDERSIHQRAFTSVNGGSMSYIEFDRGYQMITETGLANRFEAPTVQALFVDVYANRTEISRVNMTADRNDIYAGGQWSVEWQPPFASAGTVGGRGWTVELKGSSAAEIGRNFAYTGRNSTAPEFASDEPISAFTAEDGNATLRIAQANDDQMVHHYRVTVTDTATGTALVSSKVLSEFHVVPRPAVLDVPIDGVVTGSAYEAKVVAVDSYGNASSEQVLPFTA